MICGGRGAKMTAVVQGEYLQATVESVCGWALVVVK
jgi:hypothetical protein